MKLKCEPQKLPVPIIQRVKIQARQEEVNSLRQAIEADVFNPFFEEEEKKKRKAARSKRQKEAVRRANTVFTEDIVNTIMRMRKEGKTFNEIGKELGFKSRAVESCIYRRRRKAGLCSSDSYTYTPEQDAVIRKMREEGKTYKEIADELGRSVYSVRRHAHGIMGL